MDNFERTEQLYADNKRYFDAVAEILRVEHGIPENIFAATVKRIVLGQMNREAPPSFLSPPRSVLGALIQFMSAMAYFALRAAIGGRFQPVSADVLFEEWHWRSYRSFYRAIHAALPPCDAKIIATTMDAVDTADFVRPMTVIVRARQLAFSSAISKRILLAHATRFPTYWRLVRQSSFNFVDLVLRLLRQLATHESESENLRALFVVSAADNHYSALRYHVYKRNGIGRVMLIQNGARVVLVAGYNSHIHCDYYIGWSAKRLAAFRGMVCPNKLPFGSIRQHQATHDTDLPRPPDYDVVFIEQVFARPEQYDPDHSLYLKALHNLKRLAENHPELRIAYRTRPGRTVTEEREKIQDVDSLLKNSAVIFDDSLSVSSYEAISRSRLTVACNTSMRVEALAMGKRILSCNYGRNEFDFIAGNPHEIGVLFDSDYELFERKIMFLLTHEKDPGVQEYYREKRAGLEGMPGSPSERIANLIAQELARRSAGSAEREAVAS
jgi:hypothetical protein